MNARSLSPFLVSFLLVGAWLPASRLSAEDTLGSSDFSSCRSQPVDASGAYVSQAQPQPVAVAPVVSTPVVQPAPVAKSSYTISRDDLVATLSRQLANHFNVNGDLSIDVVSTWNQPPVSAEPMSATIVEYPVQLASDFVVRVHVETAGGTQPDSTIAIRAQLWRSAWATRGPVNRGEVFSPNGLDVRQVDVLRYRDALVTDSSTANLAFARGLPAGQLLSWRDIAKRSLVRRGELVEVVAVDGNLSVSMKGVAMQNGGMGDLISIRNPESQKEISAIVVAENRAEVRF